MTKPLEGSNPSDDGLSRRQFVQTGGAALAAGLAAPSLPAAADPPAEQAQSSHSTRPNIVILITDQERFPQHWPDGWADENLPNRKRLARHGLTFTRAFCSSSMCSPSRATLFTGLYPAQHGVSQTLQTGVVTTGTEPFLGQPTLQPTTQNMARMLASAGYDVQYRGKWHISKDPSGTLDVQSQRDLARYGFLGWQPPDGGQDHQPAHFGGGGTNYDAGYAAQAAAFLESADPRSSRPFALIVALINPHDIMAYPKLWDQPSFSDISPFHGSDNYGRRAPDCFDQEIDLPPTVHEDLDRNFKPPAQAKSTLMWGSENALGPLDTEREQLDYVNFYAFLHKESDRHIGRVLDALESNHGLQEKTIVIRLADHGEMGLSHGGMRQKAYNAYEETIHVPLVISSPRLFPRPVETQALASLIDLMPTLATLAGVPNQGRYTFKGRDLSPIIQDAVDHPGHPAATVQDSILFTTDETIGSGVVTQPSHVRCLREAEWKLVLYFDPTKKEAPQYELYDLRRDPTELHNMANPGSPYYDAGKVAAMKAKLDRKLIETGTAPA